MYWVIERDRKERLSRFRCVSTASLSAARRTDGEGWAGSDCSAPRGQGRAEVDRPCAPNHAHRHYCFEADTR
jgi:hypothetical protein